ncbi:uroporphyrinogen-III C-methyltransferase [Thalassotalea euphylliae]|uniref:uroporphyrinogen-III C-methyltransferase n=1 Tax=Thalassotalea euphylliae TaxID=1655234 RepID=UPI00362C281A
MTDNTSSQQTEDKAIDSKPEEKPTVQEKKASRRPAPTPSAKKRSKTAILALLCSVTALAGLGGGYVWQNEKHLALMQEVLDQNQAQLDRSKLEIERLITQQQNSTLSSASRLTNDALAPIQDKIANLEATTTKLNQRNATDWLIHEAEYLIRVASRTLWLEKDANAAIGLLKDADQRIKELNDPEFLPVRQIIVQDIETLKVLPELATQDVIIKLMALSKLVEELPIAMAHLPQAVEQEADFELSETPSFDNLSKTWDKFVADFITVRRRTANVEALLTPSQQDTLRQNLQLKLQLSQWAASQYQDTLYDQTLNEVQGWLEDYFDMDDAKVANFHQEIQLLKSEIVNLSLPSRLDSLKAIRAVLKDRPQQIERLIEQTEPAAPASEAEIKGIPNSTPDLNALPYEPSASDDDATDGSDGA